MALFLEEVERCSSMLWGFFAVRSERSAVEGRLVGELAMLARWWCLEI